jgi:hypothetical protein
VTDPVVTLRNRSTGVQVAIGSGGEDGRAGTRVRQGSFSFPAVASDGDLVAFLEGGHWRARRISTATTPSSTPSCASSG